MGRLARHKVVSSTAFAEHTLGIQKKPVLLSTLLKVDLGCRLSFVDPKPPFGQGPSTGRVERKRGRLWTHTNTQIRSLAQENTVTPPGLPTASPGSSCGTQPRTSQEQARYLPSGNSMVREGSPGREVEKPTSFSASDSRHATSGMFTDLREPEAPRPRAAPPVL